MEVSLFYATILIQNWKYYTQNENISQYFVYKFILKV